MPNMDESENDSAEELDWFEAQHFSAKELAKRFPALHEIIIEGGLKEVKT